METKQRNRRKNFTGVVASRTGDKSVKVTFMYKIPHPKFKKEIKQKTVVYVHDEKNECNEGDKVSIMETRPLSKLKRFRLIEILEKAPVVVTK